MRTWLRLSLVALAALLVVVAGIAIWAGMELRASLPQLDGERRLAGLSAPVRVTRDELGIPTIRGATRMDVARATGGLGLGLALVRSIVELHGGSVAIASEAGKGTRVTMRFPPADEGPLS